MDLPNKFGQGGQETYRKPSLSKVPCRGHTAGGAKFGPQIKCSASSTVFLLLPPEAVQIIRSDGVSIKEKILLSTSNRY